MNRRDTLLGLFALCATPLASEAQQATKRARIGFISSSTTEVSSPFLVALREGLKARGYEEAKNLTLEYRFAKSREQLPAMAADLVSLKVDVILAGGTEAVVAAKNATQTIPIVMTNSGDPVKAGFAVSLARPGGNVTGLTQISPELAGKRLQLLREVAPAAKWVGVLWHPLHPTTPLSFNETKAAAESLGLHVVSLEIREPKEFEQSFRRLAKERATALVVLRDPFTVRHRTVIAESANKLRVATMYETGDYVEAGGLMFYGAGLVDLFRRSADFVDRILKGAKAGDLPIQQPIRFELVINLKTAKAIGITMPQSLLLRADRVIE